MGVRPAFGSSLDVRQPYLSMVFQKIPGEAAWTLLNQGRTLSPDMSADTKTYSRIGDKNKKSVAGSVATSVTLHIYVEHDLKDLARALGHVQGAGWAGTEQIDLDPAFVADYKIENYDGSDAGANLIFTEYINELSPNKLTMNLEAEGDVRIGELTGTAASYYIIPAAA